MEINLSTIPEEGLEIDSNVVLSPDFYKDASIHSIEDCHVEGLIKYDYENNLVLALTVKGTFLLDDAITLEEIKYPFTCEIDEKIENLSEFCGEFYEKSKNTLDIREILWENIVLEIPISATIAKESDLSLKGDGWRLTNGKEQEIDPRFAKLQELLDEGKE